MAVSLCDVCASPYSSSFDPVVALQCEKCYPDDGLREFHSIDQFEAYLVETQPALAARIVQLDEMRREYQGPSKKKQKRDRVARLDSMTAAMGRQTLEKRQKVPKKKIEPLVTLTITDEEGRQGKPEVFKAK